MDLKQLGGSPIGTLVPIKGTDARHGAYDHLAFLPDPLPDHLALSQDAWRVVTQAATALGRLQQACAHLPNPQILYRPSIRREALSTSALEGTYAALPDLLEADIAPDQPQSPEVMETRNYMAMSQTAFDQVHERPITVGLLRELQEVLVQGTPAADLAAGRIRQHQVVIGPEGCRVEDARYVPPPPGDQLLAGLEQWANWIQTDHGLPGVVIAAVAHYQFEALHPFADGNGRLGRLIVILQLLKSGELPQPVLSISPWFEQRRRQYQEELFNVSVTGDLDQWVQFFCTGLEAQADATLRVAAQLIDFKAGIRALIEHNRLRGMVVRLAEDLIDWPVVTATWASDAYGVTFPAANSAIERLVNLGVLTEMTGRRYGRIFAAQEVLRIIESF
jgi:Fic family protein